ncbi:RadC family protein [Aggregatibacter actinomycetemcomitans]|uniref:RadC family protein n=1 Tax=Aggregatibacter actinomycetemcomitans TaxID=714 RepID=UPI00197BD0F4|nr:DNA repair protein RadC [Aggregatibacter actinomycetemcomitans]MBN6063782.1 DNA repair protein RadC [Aggregatibacter actinomycetemcomitans]MBN6081948.1 DNA repair protein RadC [Aggregatibacter actinomycetemcomitans]MBN6083686.1 DNA repair protein RadC [Aggregatibacter actinomycetemcomitans]
MNETLMPREKLLKYGAAALTDDELLAIFLRTGIKDCPVMQLSKNVLQHFGSLRELISADQKRFCAVKGIGITQFIQLQACTEMTRRYLFAELKETHCFTSTDIVKMYLQTELANTEREIFMVLFLDNQHRLIKQERLFLGTINKAMVYPREIIKEALACNAAAIILAHNHPSGVAEPSISDKQITDTIRQAADLVDIRVLDHFVIGNGRYFSFAEQNLL